MKNLKKVLALVLSMALLISTFTVSFAAEATKNLDEATKLNTMGLFNGVSTTEFKPALEDATNRIQAFVIIGRELNWDLTEIKATNTDEYYFTDVEGEEAMKMAQYAWEQGYTKGIGDNKFGSKNPVTSRELYTWFYNALGFNKDGDAYGDPMLLVKAGLASTEEAGAIIKDSYTTKKALLRDDLVGVMYAALNWKAKDSETDLVTDLVAAKKVTEEAAVAAGVYTKVVEELTVTNVEALNLVQIKVEYATDVDKDTAEDTTLYTVKKGSNKQAVANATLLEDGKTVVLTLEKRLEQQDKVSVSVKNVKDTNENKLEEITVKDIELLDTTIPSAVSAEVVGNDTIKIVFSEPIMSDEDEYPNGTSGADTDSDKELDKKAFSVNGGKLYVKNVKVQKNNTEALVELYSDLKAGDVTIEVNGKAKDFAEFGVLKSSFTIEVSEDKDAPEVVGFEKATPNGVTLIFNEDIEVKAKELKNFYHTNEKNPIDDNIDVEKDVNGNKLRLKFVNNPLPTGGVAYVYVAEKAVNDLWDNLNTQQMIKIEVDVDVTAPEVEGEVEVKAEDKVIVYFTEDLNEKLAEDEDNYQVLDADGKVVKNIIDDVEYTPSTSKKSAYVIIEFSKKLSGDHALVIEDIKDTSNNEIDDTTLSFTATDKTKPEAKDWTAKIYKAGVAGQMVRVTFGEVMATEGKYSVLDLDKYKIGSTRLVDLELEATIISVDGGKAVEIEIPAKTQDEQKGTDFSQNEILTIARVADAAGNYTADYINTRTLAESGKVYIKSVVATATDKVKITFDGKFEEFDDDDIVITTNKDSKQLAETNALDIAEVNNDLDDDGNTVIVYTLTSDAKLNHVAEKSGLVYAYVVDSISHNELDESIANNSDLDKQIVKDRIAPALAKVDHDNDNDKNTKKVVDITVDNSVKQDSGSNAVDGVVKLTFEEPINGNTLSLLTFEVEDFVVKEVTVANKLVTLFVLDKDKDTAPGAGFIEHGTQVTQKYPIKDGNGNALEGIDDEVYEPIKEINEANKAIAELSTTPSDSDINAVVVEVKEATDKGATSGNDDKYDIDTTKLTKYVDEAVTAANAAIANLPAKPTDIEVNDVKAKVDAVVANGATKGDGSEFDIDTTNLTPLLELAAEAAKYDDSQIANDVATNTTVTNTIINPSSSVEASITVTYEITEDTGSYLSYNSSTKAITLVKDNDSGDDVIAKVTMTFTKDSKSLEKVLTVTIEHN